MNSPLDRRRAPRVPCGLFVNEILKTRLIVDPGNGIPHAAPEADKGATARQGTVGPNLPHARDRPDRAIDVTNDHSDGNVPSVLGQREAALDAPSRLNEPAVSEFIHDHPEKSPGDVLLPGDP